MSDFIRHRRISPVEDGFGCVFSALDNTHNCRGFCLGYDISALFDVGDKARAENQERAKDAKRGDGLLQKKGGKKNGDDGIDVAEDGDSRR